MISGPSFLSFLKYAESLQLEEPAAREIEAFISIALDLPAESADKIPSVFQKLRRLFAPETLKKVPDLAFRIDILEKETLATVKVADIAHEKLPYEAPSAEAKEEKASSRQHKRERHEDLPSAPNKRQKEDTPEATEAAGKPEREASPPVAAAAAAPAETHPNELLEAHLILIHHHLGVDHQFCFPNDEKIFVVWAKLIHDQYVINIQGAKHFSHSSQGDKLSFSIDETGRFTSVWVNGEDTKGIALPPEWQQTVQEGMRAVLKSSPHTKALELVQRADSMSKESLYFFRPFRNVPIVIKKVIDALRAFALTKDLEARFDSDRERTIRYVFKSSVDPDHNGGLLQILADIEKPEHVQLYQNSDEKKRAATLLKDIAAFLKTLDLADK